MGLFSSEKIITNTSFTEMIENDVNDPRGRIQAIALGVGSGGNFFASYRDNYAIGFRRQYRRRMQEKMLKQYGFYPEISTITNFDGVAYAITKDGVFKYITFKTPPNGNIAISFSDEINIIHHMNILYDTSFDPELMTLTQVTINGILGDWENPRYEPNSFISANIFWSLVGGVPADDEYVPFTEKIQTTGMNDIRVIYAMSFLRNSDDKNVFETGFKIDLPGEIYVDTTMSITPVITLKENNVMNESLDEDGTGEYFEMKRMLRQLGLDGETLVKELEYACNNQDEVISYDSDGEIVDCEKYRGPTFHLDGTPQDECGQCNKSFETPSSIDNAYLWLGIYPGNKTQGAMKAMYAFFDFFVEAEAKTFSVSMSKLQLTYDFKARKSTHSGVYLELKKREYASIVALNPPEWDENGESIGTPYIPGLYVQDSIMQLYYQRTDIEYDLIEVRNYTQRTIVNTQGKEYTKFGSLHYNDGADDGNGEEIDGAVHSRIIIPLDIYNNMRYKEWVEAYEQGLVLMTYSYEKIKLKWWQTGIFKIIVIVIMIVVTVLSAGSAAGAVAAALQTLFVNMMVAMVVGMVLQAITDNPLLLAIAAIVMMAYGVGFDLASLTNGFDAMLRTATKLIETVNAYTQQTKMQELAADVEQLKELEKENEEMAEAYKEAFGDDGVLTIGNYASTAASASSAIALAEAFLENGVGENMYNFDSLYDVTGAIESRLTTTAG